MNKRTEKEIEKIYNAIFKKVYSKESVKSLSKGDRTDILKKVALLESSTKYDEFAKKFAKALAKKGIKYEVGLWRKYYKAAKESGYIAIEKTFKEFEINQMKKAIQHNFTMIKTIPRKTLEVMEHKYTTTLIEEVAKGNKSRGSFYRELKSHGAKNAKVIARTESAKLQTAIDESRSKDLGSIAYIWKSSNDKRTRPSHWAMNNVIVFWSHKPKLDDMEGHAGEFPNCRCTPIPIFDEDDLTKSNYEVYDYRTNKIITMNKKKLLEALEKGEL